MRISVFGLGYVGAVSCACLAALGHDVIGIDIVEEKVRRIAAGLSPILEPGLDEIMAKAVDERKLKATTEVAKAVHESDVAFLCVATPSTASGGVESRYLQRVCAEIGGELLTQSREYFTVMNRSTSLPAVHESLIGVLEHTSGGRTADRIGYVCHPEFLREGTAVDDFYDPPRIVFGVDDPRAEAHCRDLYPGISAETFYVSPDVAAMVKYADNCFHALKVTFGNEIGLICKTLGLDSHSLMNIFRRDRKLNISEKYLTPGNPFGGSCLPKDLRAVLDLARSSAVVLPMHAGMLESNRLQIDQLVKRIVATSGRQTVGIVGLAFKEGTDDVRESPMVSLAEQLLGKGIPVRIFDQHLALASVVGSNRSFILEAIPHLAELLSSDLAEVIAASHTLVVNHRLSANQWSDAPITTRQNIVDLVNVPELAGRANYDGLYW